MTADDVTVRLDAIRERGEKACPGPWIVERLDGYITGHITAEAHTYCGNNVERRDSVCAPPSMTRDDATFIAASRDDVPFLLAEVDRLTGQRDAALALCDRPGKFHGTGEFNWAYALADDVRSALTGTPEETSR